jgi:hypothetical protein
MAPASALSLIALLALPAAAPRQSGPEEAVPALRVPTVLFESRAGVTRSRVLEGFATRSLAAEEAVLVRFLDLEPGPRPSKVQRAAEVQLAGGEGYLRGDLLGGEGEELDLGLIGGSRLRLGLDEIASLRVPALIPADWTQPIVKSAAGDRLYRTSGGGLDRIDGTLESFDPDGLTLDSALGHKHFVWEEVAALFIEVLGDDSTQAGEAVVVDLVDGSRLPAFFSALSQDGLELVTRGGHGLRLSLPVVAEIFRPGAGIAFLSQLEPSLMSSSSPFGDDLGMRWPALRDRSTSGGPLTAGGRVWTRGLGVHAPSRIEYALGAAWSGLRGSVAVDDEVIHLPARGSVRFRVLADAKLLWQSDVMHGGDEPVPIPLLDVTGVQKLTLEVDMADEMHVGDRADWLRLILVR